MEARRLLGIGDVMGGPATEGPPGQETSGGEEVGNGPHGGSCGPDAGGRVPGATVGRT